MIISIDVETTGLNPKKHSIIQIGCAVVEKGTIQEEYKINMQPKSFENISPEAIKTHGITIEKMKSFQAQRYGFVKFLHFLSAYVNPKLITKIKPLGQNFNFDKRFLSAFMAEFEIKYEGHFNKHIELKEISKRRFPRLENYKLATVAKKLGIKYDAHDALGDARCIALCALKMGGI